MKKKVQMEKVPIKIGVPLEDHQIPLFAWQIDKDANLSRKESAELLVNTTGEPSNLLKSMYDYTIIPTDQIQKKVDYFYSPYNSKFLMRKHMTFLEDEDELAKNRPSQEVVNLRRFLKIKEITHRDQQELLD